MIKSLIRGIVLISCLTSCGYQVGSSPLIKPYETISIPFIKNDDEGLMTSIMIKTISKETGLIYQKSGGDLTLLIELVEFEDENIGYRYEYKDDGRRRNSIIPSETRINVVAKTTLIDSATSTAIAGPVMLAANVDFDHEYQKTRDGVNVFSIGQLTDYDEAYEAAYPPVYKALSEKIVDFIINS